MGINNGDLNCAHHHHFGLRVLVKLVLVAFGIALGSTAIAQLKYTEGERALIDTVVFVDSVPSAELYERAKEWMLRNLKSSDNQVSLDDDLKTRLIGTTNLLLPRKNGPVMSYYRDRVLNFKLSVFVKEGRYRVIVENIVYSYVFVNGTESNPERNTLEEWFLQMKLLEEKEKPKRVTQVKETIAELDMAIAGFLKSFHRLMLGDQDAIKGDW